MGVKYPDCGSQNYWWTVADYRFWRKQIWNAWTDSEKNLFLFQVASWFPEDVAKFGIPFSIAPVFFAWMAAASETIGGLFLVIGLKTRVAAFLIGCTMLVAIFFQKSGEGTWNMLPAMGFLWISIYSIVLGSGKIGLDYLLSKKIFNK